jgi:UDP-N-acetylglucosamine 2-epimerase
VSLGERYLSALHHVDVVVGNSSSGLLEVPSFKKPTVNIGDRQKGRVEAASVITVPVDSTCIYEAIQRALRLDCSKVENPYGDGHATERIIAALVAVGEPKALLKKRFFDLAQ